MEHSDRLSNIEESLEKITLSWSNLAMIQKKSIKEHITWLIQHEIISSLSSSLKFSGSETVPVLSKGFVKLYSHPRLKGSWICFR